MEVAPEFWQQPETLDATSMCAGGTGTARAALDASPRIDDSTTPLAVNHQVAVPADDPVVQPAAPASALGDAVDGHQRAAAGLGMPASIHGSFQGTAQAFQQSLASEPSLIAAALAAVYIVLGILYESYVHPFTILSTLPSAGVGALLALLVTRTDLSVIALIGIILLIGIVKKNAIMMIDFALEAERSEGMLPRNAISRLPAALPADPDDDHGGAPRRAAAGARKRHGSELRRPLGHHDRWRPDREPAAHAVHDTGALCRDGLTADATDAMASGTLRVAGDGAANDKSVQPRSSWRVLTAACAVVPRDTCRRRCRRRRRTRSIVPRAADRFSPHGRGTRSLATCLVGGIWRCAAE